MNLSNHVIMSNIHHLTNRKMKRRDFIRNVAPIAVVPFFSNKLFAAAYTPSVLNDPTFLRWEKTGFK